MEGKTLKTTDGQTRHASDLLVFKDDDFLMSEQQYQIEKLLRISISRQK